MKLFTAFNFDIIIIIIALFGIILGIYRGGYKQLQRTSSLLFPLIILYFLLPMISKIVNSSDKVVGFAKIVIFPKFETHLYLIINLFIGIVLYFILAMVIRLIFNLLQKKNIDYYLVKKKKLGRVIAAVISLLSSYIIVVILLYASGPFVNNTNGTVTSFLEKNTLSVNEIGTIHLYQNKYKEEFVETNELYAYISGEGISESFKYFTLLEESVNEIEQLINDKYDSLHEHSKDLLENEKTVKKLMEQKNGKYIIDLVWKIEKKTEVFNEIKAKRNFMIDNLGFINIINGDYYETNDHMFEMIVAEQEQLKDNFVTKGSLNKFNQMLSYYEFYLDNKFDLQNLIELTDADIFTYRQVMNKLFSNNTLMFVYINDFNNNYENSDNLIIQKIIKVFNKVLVNQEKILEIDEHMSFASRVVVVEDYNKWFVSKEWLNRPLVNSYFIDELLSINSEVQSLYKEMLFVYLIPEYSFEEKIDNEDIDTFIENLNTLVDQKILYYRDVNNILKILFIDNMFINRMVENELISLDTVQYAKGLIV